MRVSAPLLVLFLGVVLLAAPLAPASAQEGGSDDDRLAVPRRDAEPVFRSGADLVVLPVTVTDARQKYVTALTRADFQVYEEGTLQELAFFATDTVPLDLAILLDTSASMSNKMAMTQEAAAGFVRILRKGDRAAVIEFNDTVHVRQPLIEDRSSVEAAIRGTTARGGTALHMALYIALKELVGRKLDTADVRRQAIVLLSDGEDTRSLVTSDDVLDLVRRNRIVIYTISLRSDPAAAQGHTRTKSEAGHIRSWFVSQPDYLMQTLADETGGRAFFPTDIRELAPLYGVIGEELARQYTLGYISRNSRPDGAFRRVVVRLPTQPDAHPRTRLGYLAPRASRHADRRP